MTRHVRLMVLPAFTYSGPWMLARASAGTKIFYIYSGRAEWGRWFLYDFVYTLTREREDVWAITSGPKYRKTSPLTLHFERVALRHARHGVHLAQVLSGVPQLGEPDLQLPAGVP